MDITLALATISQTLNIAKELKTIESGIDSAEFKLKIAELTSGLADAKIALSDAKVALNEKKLQINELKTTITALKSGETCPICQSGYLKTEHINKHPTFGDMGIQEKVLRCDNPKCTHKENRMHDPMGILDK